MPKAYTQEDSKRSSVSKPRRASNTNAPDLSNGAIFRAQAAEKERLSRLPLATKLRMLKELAEWAGPLEEALKEDSGPQRQ
jgi:hypothetical protein